MHRVRPSPVSGRSSAAANAAPSEMPGGSGLSSTLTPGSQPRAVKRSVRSPPQEGAAKPRMYAQEASRQIAAARGAAAAYEARRSWIAGHPLLGGAGCPPPGVPGLFSARCPPAGPSAPPGAFPRLLRKALRIFHAPRRPPRSRQASRGFPSNAVTAPFPGPAAGKKEGGPPSPFQVTPPSRSWRDSSACRCRSPAEGPHSKRKAAGAPRPKRAGAPCGSQER